MQGNKLVLEWSEIWTRKKESLENGEGIENSREIPCVKINDFRTRRK